MGLKRVGNWGRRWALCLVLFVPVLSFAARPLAWPHESSEIEPHPDVVWGRLDNGFRYALLPHDAKKGVISLRLVVGVGALDEEDDEQGAAHFIEHMAFEGTKRFKPGELIAFFQRLGMSYGVDVNAFTYHEKTVYHLELPQNDLSLIRDALSLYRDYGDGILFDPARVENEREVILREKQARETPSALIGQESFRFFFDGMRLAKRHPIGTEAVIRGIDREELVEFYQKWYRPSLMTLVAVGDLDTEAFAAEIEAAFGSMEERRGRVPKRKLGKLARSKAFRTGSLDIEGVDRFTLEISRSWMERDKGDTWERRRTDMLRSLATSLFNERCRTLIDGMSDNFASYNRVFGVPYCQLSISSGGEFWWEAFVWMDQLMRQASSWGFSSDELDYLRENWLRGSKVSAARIESAEPRDLIDGLVDRLVAGEVYASPEESRRRSDEWLKAFTLEEVNDAFREVWELKQLSYFVAGDFETPFSGKLLKDRLKVDRSFALMPYEAPERSDFSYTEFEKSGTVVERRDVPEIGATTYLFDNNVRLSFLRTDNEKETVRVLVRVGGGMLSFTDTNPGTHALAMASLFRSGFGGHAIEDVYKELRSHVSTFVFGVEDHDAFTYRGLAPVEGLDEFLKIVAEYLVDPTVKDEAFVLAQSKLAQSRELEPDGMSQGYRDLYRMLYPGQPRFHSPSLSDIRGVDPARIRDWLEETFREGYLEVAVVGDVDEAEVVSLVSETLGAIPQREAEKDSFESVRGLTVESTKGRTQIQYANGKGENAASVIVWTIQEPIDLRESAALYVLSSVLETRIRERVREEMGATYAPLVNYLTYAAYDHLRHIRADVDCMKGDAEGVLDVVLEIAEGLGRETVSAAEMKAAVAPMEERIRQSWRDNGYLLDNVLGGLHEYPESVELAVAYRDGLLSTITAEEVQAVAKRFLGATEALAVAIVPAVDAKVAEAPKWQRDVPAAVAE